MSSSSSSFKTLLCSQSKKEIVRCVALNEASTANLFLPLFDTSSHQQNLQQLRTLEKHFILENDRESQLAQCRTEIEWEKLQAKFKLERLTELRLIDDHTTNDDRRWHNHKKRGGKDKSKSKRHHIKKGGAQQIICARKKTIQNISTKKPEKKNHRQSNHKSINRGLNNQPLLQEDLPLIRTSTQVITSPEKSFCEFLLQQPEHRPSSLLPHLVTNSPARTSTASSFEKEVSRPRLKPIVNYIDKCVSSIESHSVSSKNCPRPFGSKPCPAFKIFQRIESKYLGAIPGTIHGQTGWYQDQRTSPATPQEIPEWTQCMHFQCSHAILYSIF